MCIHCAGANGGDLVIRFQDVTRTRQHEQFILRGCDEHGFESPEKAIHPPVLCQLDGCPFHVAAVTVELFIEAVQQRKRIGCRAGKPHKNFSILKLTDFSDIALRNIISHRRLTVTTDGDVAFVKDGEYGCGVDVQSVDVLVC